MRRNSIAIKIGIVFFCFAEALSERAVLAEQMLRSPWDGKPIATTSAPYDCPAAPNIPPDLTTDGFYRLDDPTHSIVDPVRQAAYQKSSGPVKAAGQAIVAAADAYRTSGSRQAAECALKLIVAMAQQHSLTGKMSSNQAYYVQGWVAGAVAIAYLKIRDTHLLTPQQTKSISDWLVSVGEQTKGYFDPRRKIGRASCRERV